MEPIKVILVDDHQIVRDGIKSLLTSSPIIEVIGEACDGYELFSLLKEKMPDIVLLDINLPKMSGIEICHTLSKDFPKIKKLMLSMNIKEDFIFNAIKAGANGYLPKTTTKKELQEAVETIFKGHEYYSDAISAILAKSFINKAKGIETAIDKPEDILTTREIEILKLVAEGQTNQEIADQLYISIRTVETHKTNIMQKLDIKTTVDLVKFAIKHKIIEI